MKKWKQDYQGGTRKVIVLPFKHLKFILLLFNYCSNEFSWGRFQVISYIYLKIHVLHLLSWDRLDRGMD